MITICSRQMMKIRREEVDIIHKIFESDVNTRESNSACSDLPTGYTAEQSLKCSTIDHYYTITVFRTFQIEGEI